MRVVCGCIAVQLRRASLSETRLTIMSRIIDDIIIRHPNASDGQAEPARRGYGYPTSRRRGGTRRPTDPRRRVAQQCIANRDRRRQCSVVGHSLLVTRHSSVGVLNTIACKQPDRDSYVPAKYNIFRFRVTSVYLFVFIAFIGPTTTIHVK